MKWSHFPPLHLEASESFSAIPSGAHYQANGFAQKMKMIFYPHGGGCISDTRLLVEGDGSLLLAPVLRQGTEGS